MTDRRWFPLNDAHAAAAAAATETVPGAMARANVEPLITVEECRELFGAFIPIEGGYILENSSLTLAEKRSRLRALAAISAPEAQREGLADRVGKLAGYHSERANLAKRDAKKAVRDRVPFHEQAKTTLYEAAIALGRPIAREGLAGRLAELSAKARLQDDGHFLHELLPENYLFLDALVQAYRSGALSLHATSQPLPQEGGRVPDGWRPQPVPVDRLIEEGRTTQLRQRLHDELYTKARIAALNDTAGFLLAMGHEKHREHVLGAASLIAELVAPQPPTPSANEPAENLTLGAIKGRDRLAPVQASPSAEPDALAKQVPEGHSIEDVLTDFATREGNPYVRLHDFVAKFPQYAKELVEMAEELSLDAQNRLVRVKTDNGIEIYDPWFPSAPRIICRAAIAQAETGKAGASGRGNAALADLLSGWLSRRHYSMAQLEELLELLSVHRGQILGALRDAPSPEPSRQGVEAITVDVQRMDTSRAMSGRVKLTDRSGWSCEDKPRQHDSCRNPHGCHCREITALRKRVAELEAKTPALRATLKAQEPK